jgi:hypothetical protein
MTQRDTILYALRRGDRIKCTDAYPVYHISPHSFTRIIKELRDSGIGVLDFETKPDNGGTPYKTYYIDKPARVFRQHNNICECGKSYWSVNENCNKCGVKRGIS